MTLIIGHYATAWAYAGKSLADLGLAAETKERKNYLHVVLLAKLLFFRDAVKLTAHHQGASDFFNQYRNVDALVKMLF